MMPSVFHGGDDLNDALAHLSWKEMAFMAGAILLLTVLIIVSAAF